MRALQDIDWPLEVGSHLLLGGTGEGKTSLLEAMYLAVTTRSFRTRRLSDCERRSSPHQHEGVEAESLPEGFVDAGFSGFFCAVEVETASRARLEFSWNRRDGASRRLNGDRSTLEEHLNQQPILAWSGADIEVLVGSPELRRRLIDRVSVALDARALTDLSRYRRALEHKRALLTQPSATQRQALESFNVLLAESSERLVARRAATIELLRSALGAVCEQFPRPDFAIDLAYRSSPRSPEPLAEDPSERQEGAVLDSEAAPKGWALEGFSKVLENERRTQRPQVGPHRDRIDVLFRGRPVAETASAGERKAIGLLLLAAQTSLLCGAQRAPVLLVDDVDTEMDQATLEALWPQLNQAPQTFFSSNREPVFSQLVVDSRWAVHKGSVKGL